MLDLTCDSVGPVAETVLREVVPAVMAWIKRENHPLTHLYSGVISRLLMTVQVYLRNI